MSMFVPSGAMPKPFCHDLGFDTIGYVELFRDLRPTTEQPWRDGETIADRRFRVKRRRPATTGPRESLR